MRRGPGPRLIRQGHPVPAQPRRRPSGQLSAVAHCVHPDGQRPENQALHRAPDNRRSTKKEAIRCLKRYVAREVFSQLPRPALALDKSIGASFRGGASCRPAGHVLGQTAGPGDTPEPSALLAWPDGAIFGMRVYALVSPDNREKACALLAHTRHVSS